MPGQDVLAFQGGFINGYGGAACANIWLGKGACEGKGKAGWLYLQSSSSQLVFSSLADKAVIFARATCGSLSCLHGRMMGHLLLGRSRVGEGGVGAF